MRLEPDAIVLQQAGRDEEANRGFVVRLVFEGTSPSADLIGEGKQPGERAYFLGSEPERWRVGVPSFDAVVYRGLYEGTDLRVREQGGGLEYDLVFASGASPDRVTIRCEGVEGLETDADGGLLLHLARGSIRQTPPRAWEETAGGLRTAHARYTILGPDRFGFQVARNEAGCPLVIDPGVEWGTFLGGSDWDNGTAVRIDAAGAAVVAGTSMSWDFPTTPGAYDPTLAGLDAFVLRLTADGSALVTSTLLGGSGMEFVTDLEVDASGSVTVAGTTLSVNFPTTPGAFDTSFNGGSTAYPTDGFVARIAPAGNALLYSTFLGGSGEEGVLAIRAGQGGTVTVAGATGSSNFPMTAGAFDPTYNGDSYDAFVARLNGSGSGLLYSTYLGGAQIDNAYALAVDGSGSAIVVGETRSPLFPITAGAYDGTYNGGGSFPGDVFASRLDPGAGALLYSTFLGGTDFDRGMAVALGSGGEIFLTGWTYSTDFPTTAGAFDTTYAGYPSDTGEGFVTRLAASGAALSYSTYIGGGTLDAPIAMALDDVGRVTVVGLTRSVDFPTTPGAFQTLVPGPAGADHGFVARLDSSGGGLSFSAYLGGVGIDAASAIDLDAAGGATVVGRTFSPNFPTTPTGFDTILDGGTDAFAVRLDLLPIGVTRYSVSTPGCAGPLAIGVDSWPQVGNAAFACNCANAPGNSPGVLAMAAGPANPAFFIGGVLVALDPTILALLPTSSDASGWSEAAIPIPASASLAGLSVYAQFFWLDPCAPAGVSGSNALAIVVQP